MIKIELKNASNGIIKTVLESSRIEEKSESLKVYEIYPDLKTESYVSIIDLLEDIMSDLCLDRGSDYEEHQLNFVIDWGEKYTPKIEEIDEKIKNLKFQIKELKELKEIIINNGDNC